jgi:hypothetical protein
MSDIREEPPDDNEQYEPLDEEDITGEDPGPEGQRDLDSELIVDETELEGAGVKLGDPDRISVLAGGMDDPEGTGPPEHGNDAEAGWDVDPTATAAARDEDTEDGGAEDPELELVDVDPHDLDDVPDDAPGADSARW